MMRILHLLEHPADFETRRGIDGLCRALGEGFSTEQRTIGFGGDWRDVATSAAKLRRSAETYDVIHAWGGRALTVAALGANSPIIFSPLPQASRRAIGWVRAVSSYRHVEVVCPTFTLRRRFVEHGISIERCHLIRPGVELPRIKRRNNSTLRAELGFSDTDHVILAVGESTRSAGHELAMWTATVLHVLDPKYKLLMWGRGPVIGRIRNLAGRVRSIASIHFAEQQLGRAIEFEELPAACETILVTATGPVATLPIAICMASGLPIVSTTSYTVGELLEDRHTALLIGTQSQRDLARRVLDLQEDGSLQWSIADMAKTEAFEFFAFTRFVNQFRTIYRQLAAGERVNVPENAPGAGLRFHGRA